MTEHQDLGQWVRLSAGFHLDPRIMRAGTNAELVFVRGLAVSRALRTDGHVAAEHLHLVGHGLSAGALNRARDALVAEGLWEACADGWRVPPAKWARWQTTEVEYAERRERERERKAEWRRKQAEGEQP